MEQLVPAQDVIKPDSINNVATMPPEQNQDVDGSSEKWGMPLGDLYRLGMSFFKDKSGKAVHFSYEDNLRLIAFTQQASHGPLEGANAKPLGVLDVIGRDRRLAWQQLGSISRVQSQEGFIDSLDRLCPSFRPYIEAIKQDRDEKQRLAVEHERAHTAQQEVERLRQEDQRHVEAERNREEQQRRQLQDALNQQTFHQFKAYAEKQYPGNPDEQALLIRQLQTEHYHQYMQQLQAQVVVDSVDANNKLTKDTALVSGGTVVHERDHQHTDGVTTACQHHHSAEDDAAGDSDDASGEYPVLSPANLWTRPDIKQFKQEVSAGKGDGVIHVGHGHTVTVRVPTREGGQCLFWEFATDSYDVGFGVYFEWGKPVTAEVSVHVTDSDEEDDEDDDTISANDVEAGNSAAADDPPQEPIEPANTPLTTSIIPIYRRDSHQEVYVGSHTYPGEGVYLLKFDNSYSMWRSKTLYYRVYYTR